MLTSVKHRQYIDDAEESKEEKGRPKDSGPKRGSGEAAKGGGYHGKSKISKRPRSPEGQRTPSVLSKRIMIRYR